MARRQRIQKMKRVQRDIAGRRVDRLMVLAEAAALEGHLARAHRYAWLARRVALRHQLGSPRALRGRVCRGCSGYLHPGVTARVRVRDGRLVATCLRCGRIRRRPLGEREG